CWSIVASPWRRSNCFGRFRRLLGQNRVPEPPAMTIAWSIFDSTFVLSGGRILVLTRRDLRRCPWMDQLGQIQRLASHYTTGLDGIVVVTDLDGESRQRSECFVIEWPVLHVWKDECDQTADVVRL